MRSVNRTFAVHFFDQFCSVDEGYAVFFRGFLLQLVETFSVSASTEKDEASSKMADCFSGFLLF